MEIHVASQRLLNALGRHVYFQIENAISENVLCDTGPFNKMTTLDMSAVNLAELDAMLDKYFTIELFTMMMLELNSRYKDIVITTLRINGLFSRPCCCYNPKKRRVRLFVEYKLLKTTKL